MEHPSISLLAVRADIYNDKLVVAVDYGKEHDGVGPWKQEGGCLAHSLDSGNYSSYIIAVNDKQQLWEVITGFDCNQEKRNTPQGTTLARFLGTGLEQLFFDMAARGQPSLLS